MAGSRLQPGLCVRHLGVISRFGVGEGAEGRLKEAVGCGRLCLQALRSVLGAL